jgi:hypothetical protein
VVDSIRFNGVKFSNSQHGNFSLVQFANRLDMYDSLIKLIQESIILDNITITYNEGNEISIKLDGITTNYLANDAVTADKIQNYSITTDKINTDAVTKDKLNENILSTSIVTNAENELIVAISDDTILENQDGLYVNPNYLVKKYETVIGNNSSRIFDITHNLNTKNIFVEVYVITSGLDVTNYTKQRINNNTVRLEFQTKPPTNGYVVNIIG